MNRHDLFTVLMALALITSGPVVRPVTAQDVSADRPEGIQVLTRGPVHEAFAETVTYDPQPGIVVAKEPPPPIEERPPEQKPEGTNVVWIPGYWAWDDEPGNFIWVSGVWRDVPPGRQWVPGYWASVAEGFQWIAGYWAPADTTEVQYLPEPPQTLEAGPSAPPASPDDMWVPGYWDWEEDRYVWVPGFWRRPQPDWIWVPARYNWTPRGCVFAQGYWDYPVGRRGLLFAPVRFVQPLYTRSDFYFSPAIVIAADLLTNHLFCRPAYHHYYFGDYYAAEYGSRGIYPWFTFYHSRAGYDPIYAYQRWQHLRNDRDWERRVETEYRVRQENAERRPPHTFAALQERLAGGVERADKNAPLAMPLAQLAKRPESPVRLQPVDKQERVQQGQAALGIQKFREERLKSEVRPATKPSEVGGKPTVPATGKLPRSPLGIPPADKPAQDERAHGNQVTPKPVPEVEHPSRPKAESRPEGRPEPRPAPRVEQRPERRPEPRPAPRVEQRPERRPDPRPAPRVEQRPERRPEPRPAPRVEQRPERRPEPASRSESRPSHGNERSKHHDR
jgi:hypothetical protein